MKCHSVRIECFCGKEGTEWYRRKPNQRTKNPTYNKVTENRLILDSFPKKIKFILIEYYNKTRLNVGQKQRVRVSATFCDRSIDFKATKVCINFARLICRDRSSVA